MTCGDYGVYGSCDCQWVYDHSTAGFFWNSWWYQGQALIGCKLQRYYQDFEKNTCTGVTRVMSCGVGSIQDMNCVTLGQSCWDQCDYYQAFGNPC